MTSHASHPRIQIMSYNAPNDCSVNLKQNPTPHLRGVDGTLGAARPQSVSVSRFISAPRHFSDASPHRPPKAKYQRPEAQVRLDLGRRPFRGTRHSRDESDEILKLRASLAEALLAASRLSEKHGTTQHHATHLREEKVRPGTIACCAYINRVSRQCFGKYT